MEVSRKLETQRYVSPTVLSTIFSTRRNRCLPLNLWNQKLQSYECKNNARQLVYVAAIKDRMACPLALRRQGHKPYGCNQPYISLKTL